MKASHSQVRIIITSDTEFISISDEEVRVMENCASRGLFLCVSSVSHFYHSLRNVVHESIFLEKVYIRDCFKLKHGIIYLRQTSLHACLQRLTAMQIG